MWTYYEVELLARLRQEELAREAAAARAANHASGSRDGGRWRRRLARALLAVATRLAPVERAVGELAVEAEATA